MSEDYTKEKEYLTILDQILHLKKQKEFIFILNTVANDLAHFIENKDSDSESKNLKLHLSQILVTESPECYNELMDLKEELASRKKDDAMTLSNGHLEVLYALEVIETLYSSVIENNILSTAQNLRNDLLEELKFDGQYAITENLTKDTGLRNAIYIFIKSLIEKDFDNPNISAKKLLGTREKAFEILDTEIQPATNLKKMIDNVNTAVGSSSQIKNTTNNTSI